MYGDKKVGFGIVGYLCAAVQRDEHVCLPGVNDLDIRTITLDETAECQGYPEVDVLFLACRPDRPGIVSPMTCIDDQHKILGAEPDRLHKQQKDKGKPFKYMDGHPCDICFNRRKVRIKF